MSLELSNVVKTYREPDGNILTVLDIERFQIAPAEQVVLVGVSGGGKTSLLNVISGISTPDSGSVKVDGLEITRLPDAKRALQLLERVGLGHRTSHRPPQLSVGEQQRVAVARALANQPTLLLADEPTANVDVKNQDLILDLIREGCAESKVALLMVTHSPEVAARFQRVDRLENFNRAASGTGAAR
jgi:putative ABC transport system ATP-binding protein